jgi:hypothetical protein
MKNSILHSPLSRRLLIILGASFVLSLTLELYVFGFPEDFFSRWIRTWFFIFVLVAGSALVIIPLVNMLVNRLVK